VSEESMQPRASFEQEALPHLDAVYRFALRLSGAPDRAEDLTQETFLRAFRSWDQYMPGTQCKSWLFTICRNVFLRQRERRQRHEEIVQENTARNTPGVEPVNPVWASVIGVDPEGEFFESLVDDAILDAIDGLQEEYRSAVVLSDVEGLSYMEIAELMDVPVGTVKSRLFRGRRQLQKALYDYAVEMGHLPAKTATDT
jgi:RNA polymerase sigma-70 factor (ECF subfamily)